MWGGGIPKVIGAAAGGRLKMEQGAGKRCLKSSGKVDWVGRVMEVEKWEWVDSLQSAPQPRLIYYSFGQKVLGLRL